MGLDYPLGMRIVREAALAGHPEALYLYGRSRYADLWMDGPVDEDSLAEHERYVFGMAYIATAARLGNEEASRFFPAPVLAGLLAPEGPVPETLEIEAPPTAGVPYSWLEDAREIVSRWRACWPEALVTPPDRASPEP